MPSQIPILTVTQLNRQIRSWLEHEIGQVDVEGEVSTLTKPSSGHFYFTLKDAMAQVRCVFFRNRHPANCSTLLQTGQQIIVHGQLSLYEARGDYQLIVEKIEAAGQGDLFRQFELLKTKLAALGLFEPARKRCLPKFPQTIGVITSPTGAALHDILTTLARRYPVAAVIVYPSEVQGAQASQQLLKALHQATTEQRCDVLILARGGGSIEDLWAFNDEQLAIAIANSVIPIVSGVGHETDFTIADFVADVRAATPTAAAETVTPNQLELVALLEALQSRLHYAISRIIQHQRLILQHQVRQLSAPGRLIRTHYQTLDYLQQHLLTAIQQKMLAQHHRYQMMVTRLHALNPVILIRSQQARLRALEDTLIQTTKQALQMRFMKFHALLSTLHAVSPLATLNRGYAIATYQQHVLLDTTTVTSGDVIQVRLSKGELTCEVV
jgi:exodeoxyribonuclease VII large subunit